MPIDDEGMLFLFNRHVTEGVVAVDLIADAVAHQVDPDQAMDVLGEMVQTGMLQWARGATLQRAD